MPLTALCLALSLFPQDPVAADKPKSETPAAPKTAVAKKGDLRATLQRQGRLVPVAPHEVKLELDQYSGELKVLEVVAHGHPVNAGDILLRLDTARIDEQLRKAEMEMAHAERKAAAAEEEARMAEAASRDDLQRSESELEWARRRLQGYLEFEISFDREQDRLWRQMTQHGLEDAQDELGQLEKMYKEDELVDATEEIVLKRSRRDFAWSQARAKLSDRQDQYEWDYPKAMERQRRELEAQLQVKSAERARRRTEMSRGEREMSLERARFELERQRRDLEQLRADRDRLAVRAPRGGIALHGETDAAPTSKGITVGSRASAGSVLMVIADPDRLEIRTEVPETHLYRATSGKAATVELTALPDQEFIGAIRVELMPSGRDGEVNTYRATVPIAKADPRHRPGMGCKVTVVLDQVSDAVLVPLEAVTRKDGQRTVRVGKAATGPFEQRKVTVGPDDGKDIVITQGVAAGEFVVLEEKK